MAKDQFTDWLRDKILQNPQEPPANTWQGISNDLDLEEGWEKIAEELEINSIWDRIDSRLGSYYHVRKFEKISQGISAVVLLVVFIGFFAKEPFSFFNSSPTKNSLALEQNENEKLNLPPVKSIEAQNNLDEAPVSASSSINKDAGSNTSRAAGSNEAIASDRISKIKKNQKFKEEVGSISTETSNSIVQVVSRKALGQQPKEAIIQDNSLIVSDLPWMRMEAIKGILEIENSLLLSKPAEISESKKANKTDKEFYPSTYLGVGSAMKISWLLNHKTLQAMEKNTLLTAAPAFQTDYYFLYGTRLKPRVYLQTDIYLKDRVGQEYQEYRNGSFGKVEDRLEYQSLGLTLSFMKGRPSYGRFPTHSRLLAGLYGGRLLEAKEISSLGTVFSSEEYANVHFGMLTGYEYNTFLSNKFTLTYGLRSRLDLLNIYSGDDLIPATFRKTRAFSLDFSVSLKYSLKK